MDIGSGAGFDSFAAAHFVGPTGEVLGVDMTEEMLAKSRAAARALGLSNVEFREGLDERMPVEDSWADAVISNGAINLRPDKRAVFSKIHRVLRPGSWLQFADIANGNPVHLGRPAGRHLQGSAGRKERAPLRGLRLRLSGAQAMRVVSGLGEADARHRIVERHFCHS